MKTFQMQWVHDCEFVLSFKKNVRRELTMNKKVLISVLAAAATCTLVFAGCGEAVTNISSTPASATGSTVAGENQNDKISGTLTLNGSTSMTQVCQALGEAFQAKYQDVKVEKAGTGSGAAVQAVASGNALIGDLSRDLKEDENPDQFEKVQIAIDGIAVAVNKNNPVTDLTTEQVTKIFSGEITNWKDVGGEDHAITVLGREANSGTRDGFEGIFKADKYAYAAELTSTGEVVNRIGSDPYAIGYISLGSVNDTVTACKIDGVEATEENVSNGTYTASRPFIQIYKKGSDSELIQAWFDFIKSEEGQAVIKEAGVIPVTK